MKEKTCKTVRLVYGILLGIMTVILGALFIWQTLDIYFTGTSQNYEGAYIFTRDVVGEHLKTIAPAFWLWIVMIIVCFALSEVFPVKAKRVKQDVRYTLWRLKKRIPATAEGDLACSLNVVRKEEKIIKILWIICGAVGLAGIIYAIVYLATPSHFPKVDVTGEMLNMVKNLLPWAVAVFAVACGITVYEGFSANRQLEHVRKLSAGKKPVEAHGKVYEFFHHKYFLLGLRICVGCLGVAFVLADVLPSLFIEGYVSNMANILIKAINICSECIGLG